MGKAAIFAALAAVEALGAPLAGESTACEKLSALALPHAQITIARAVAAGAFEPPAGVNPNQTQTLRKLPAFCRIAATLRPTDDSEIRIETWLPANWNGKLQAVGNGGWNGAINFGGMAAAISAGYATASTDTGHATRDGAFAIGHPEKLADFGWRAVHEMTIAAKALIAAYYGEAQ